MKLNSLKLKGGRFSMRKREKQFLLAPSSWQTTRSLLVDWDKATEYQREYIMIVYLLYLILLLLTQGSCLYEDQIGKFDWWVLALKLNWLSCHSSFFSKILFTIIYNNGLLGTISMSDLPLGRKAEKERDKHNKNHAQQQCMKQILDFLLKKIGEQDWFQLLFIHVGLCLPSLQALQWIEQKTRENLHLWTVFVTLKWSHW